MRLLCLNLLVLIRLFLSTAESWEHQNAPLPSVRAAAFAITADQSSPLHPQPN
jgi:hypothetical protein